MTPHAPWSEGPADFGIGLRPIAASAWFEGGEPPQAVVARKTALLRRSPALVWAETPASHAGQAEALALIEAATGLRAPGQGPLLWRAGLLVSDDLCLMERLDGAWTLTALSLCAGSLFNAAEVAGRSLATLHAPVPGFAERLLARVERIFDHLGPDAVLERRNWSVVASGALHLPHAADERVRAAAARSVDDLHTRVERQTLRRLPQTGGLLFTIRPWVRPAAELDAQERESLAAAWRGARPGFRTYKAMAILDDLMERWFASWGSPAATTLPPGASQVSSGAAQQG